ncbi:(2Fe-2S) ferredoxin domain-containing protein [Kineosporia babensis]|uniref:(2Fe-2S) ferredoxin domain-containing protein n=1 Tax=Kineosporia babensis TaxID=499548 RepID=A0A9X1NHI4_9ACTN|nr:(2Fe-2S) ferredoxin domain-containing protein [Kineosporia babensis]MCD5313669.1 (2Fe-2S) ferredoxin domain-containing protein [Kineosporia babensis]
MSRQRKPGRDRGRPNQHLAAQPVPHRSHLGAPSGDQGGPVVAVCTGPRCAALCRLTGTGSESDPLNARLREATRQTTGGILISTGCLGRCDLSAVVLLTWRYQSPPPIALAGMHQPQRMQALTEWLPGHGPRRALFERRMAAGDLADAMAEAAEPQLLPPGS